MRLNLNNPDWGHGAYESSGGFCWRTHSPFIKPSVACRANHVDIKINFGGKIDSDVPCVNDVNVALWLLRMNRAKWALLYFFGSLWSCVLGIPFEKPTAPLFLQYSVFLDMHDMLSTLLIGQEIRDDLVSWNMQNIVEMNSRLILPNCVVLLLMQIISIGVSFVEPFPFHRSRTFDKYDRTFWQVRLLTLRWLDE